jgi:transmembrane 9 superfamily protein 2/4
MNQQVTTCQLLCKQKIPSSDLEFIKGAISEGYLVNWLVDGLPAAQYADRVSIGFQLGYVSEPEKVALNNHYDITISVHKQKLENRYTVVGVEVDPKSLRTRSDCTKSGAEPLLLGSESVDMEYSYTLKFKLSDTEWGTGWDHYLKMTDQKVHWFGMIDSVLVAFMLSGIVSMILFRTLRRDIIRYNELDVNEEAHEDFGWKLVHGDVFRPPRHRLLLSLLIGNGCQILLMSLCTIGFAALGFLSPASRGSMPTVMLVSYLLFGSVNGYVSTRFYKLFGGEAWRQAVTLTTLVLPGYSCITQLFICYFACA